MDSNQVKKGLKNYLLNDKGSVLLTVLLLLLLLALIGSSALMSSMNNFNVAIRMSQYEDNYYVAEANAQYALSFVKEEITDYYRLLYEIPSTNRILYNEKFNIFYQSIIASVCTDDAYAATCQFEPLEFTEDGVTVEVTIEVDENTYPAVNNPGELGDPVRFLITSTAESNGVRRTVNAVIEVDDPRIEWKMTSAPPMTDMRMLIGSEVVLTDSWEGDEYNSIFCRGDALVAKAFVLGFLEDHEEYAASGYYTYDYSNAVPEMLAWNLQYEKFPVHEAFNAGVNTAGQPHDSFNALFEASKIAIDKANDPFYDWRNNENTTIDYNIKNYAPNYYTSDMIVDSSMSGSDVIYKNTDPVEDSNYFVTNKKLYVTTNLTISGGENNISNCSLYADGNITIDIDDSLINCYIFAEGDVTIDIEGYVKNTIIIANSGIVDINCDYIVNDFGDGIDSDDHMLIKAAQDITLTINSAYNSPSSTIPPIAMKNVIVRSMEGGIYVLYDKYRTQDKTMVDSCYFHTNETKPKGRIKLENLYFYESFISAGKDLMLRNCSGENSSFYAHGTTDDDLNTVYGTEWRWVYVRVWWWYEWKYMEVEVTGSDYLFSQDNYNRYTEYSSTANYYTRNYQGIIVVSELPGNSTNSFRDENKFHNCDFTTGQNMFLSDPHDDYHVDTADRDSYLSSGYRYYYWPYAVELTDCRIMAAREVRLEDVVMDTCYVYAGNYGYEDESPYNSYGTYRIGRGLFFRADNLVNRMTDCVMYTGGKMMYSQNTPENRYPVDPYYKVRVYSSFYYSVGNFEYDGKSTSAGLDTTIMRNLSEYCNDIIIMTESNLGPHELSPSTRDDVLFVGGAGDMEKNSELEHYSDKLERLIGVEAQRGYMSNEITVQCDVLYDNYFEQRLDEDEMIKQAPTFTDVFVYEDIYEKKEAGNGGT